MIVAAAILLLTAGHATAVGGEIDIELSRKNNVWYVAVSISKIFGRPKELAAEALESGRSTCSMLLASPPAETLPRKPSSVIVGNIAEAVLRALLVRARWSGPCSALLGPGRRGAHK